MNPALSKAIDDANLERILAEIEDAKQQINSRPVRGSGFTKEQEEEQTEQDKHLGERLLKEANEKLRKAMYGIGRACAVDPEIGPTANADPGTFYKLFGDRGIDTTLLQDPVAKDAFLEGLDAARKGLPSP